MESLFSTKIVIFAAVYMTLAMGLVIGGRSMSRTKDDPEFQKVGRGLKNMGVVMMVLLVVIIFGKWLYTTVG